MATRNPLKRIFKPKFSGSVRPFHWLIGINNVRRHLAGRREASHQCGRVCGRRRAQTTLMLANLLSVCKTIKIIECVVACHHLPSPPLPSHFDCQCSVNCVAWPAPVQSVRWADWLCSDWGQEISPSHYRVAEGTALLVIPDTTRCCQNCRAAPAPAPLVYYYLPWQLRVP